MDFSEMVMLGKSWVESRDAIASKNSAGHTLSISLSLICCGFSKFPFQDKKGIKFDNRHN